MIRALWATAAAALLLASSSLPVLGCAKEDKGTPSASVKALPVAEVERARTACAKYVTRVCACAETQPDMVEVCALAKARPQALELNLDLITTPGLEPAEAKAVKVEARKIAAACFEDEAKLDAQKCPRVAN